MTIVQALPRNVQRQLDEATALEAGLAQQIESAAKPAQSVRALLDPALAPASQQPVAHVQSATAAPGAPKDDFEHKYRVLQGMYEADVRKATARQNALDARLAAIEAAPPATTATAQPNKDDLDKFGADLIDMVKRYAENEMQGLKDRVTAVEQKVGRDRKSVV